MQGAKFFMQAGQDITIGGRLSRTQYQYTLTDTDLDELNHWAPILERAMRKLPELQDVASDQQIAAPHIAIDGRPRCRLAARAVGVDLIDQTLYDAFGQRQVATIYTATNQYKVILEVAAAIPATIRTRCRRSMSPSPTGAQVPLSAFAHFTPKIEPLSVNHQGQFPAVTLSFNLAPGTALGQAVDSIQTTGRPAARSADAERLVPGHGAGVPGVAVLDAAAGRRRRSWSSTSCWACCTRAISIRSRSCPRCRRPVSARW